MKKLILIVLSFVTIISLTISSPFVFANDMSATSTENINPKDFQDHKDKILKHIDERISKMQGIQKCVQAAQDSKALQACRPKDKDGHNKEHK